MMTVSELSHYIVFYCTASVSYDITLSDIHITVCIYIYMDEYCIVFNSITSYHIITSNNVLIILYK